MLGKLNKKRDPCARYPRYMAPFAGNCKERRTPGGKMSRQGEIAEFRDLLASGGYAGATRRLAAGLKSGG